MATHTLTNLGVVKNKDTRQVAMSIIALEHSLKQDYEVMQQLKAHGDFLVAEYEESIHETVRQITLLSQALRNNVMNCSGVAS